MKLESFEKSLLRETESAKGIIGGLFNNMGRAVAIIATLITLLITFADISFGGMSLGETAPTLLLLLTSSYIIYFSLEGAGERLGEGEAEYIAAKERFCRLSAELHGEDIEGLRIFLEEYLRRELCHRRKCTLIKYGLTEAELEAYMSGGVVEKSKRRGLKKAASQKPAQISIRQLLSYKPSSEGGELENPGRRKLAGLILKLIPTTLCMTVTVSVILSVKQDMGVSDVLNALLKLSTLPIIGFRGYAAGFSYTKNALPQWFNAKSNLLEMYLSGEKI